MWKKALLGFAAVALVAFPVLAEEWRVVPSTGSTSPSETTTATASVVIQAGTTTPIAAGIYHVRVLARTTPAWIYFMQTPFTYSTHYLNGRMSEFGTFVPANVPEYFVVSPGMRWVLQGEGGSSVVTVTQVSQ